MGWMEEMNSSCASLKFSNTTVKLGDFPCVRFPHINNPCLVLYGSKDFSIFIPLKTKAVPRQWDFGDELSMSVKNVDSTIHTTGGKKVALFFLPTKLHGAIAMDFGSKSENTLHLLKSYSQTTLSGSMIILESSPATGFRLCWLRRFSCRFGFPD
eukprot:Colp12_sorted_trinity150504_noHs@21747